MDSTPIAPPLLVPAPQTMAEQVMNHVRERIQTGQMTPGTWYSVYQLSEQLGISRSPVRDGLLRLEEAGLIEFVRNRGFQVIEPTPADVADIFSLRLSIEPHASYRAAKASTSSQLEELRAIYSRMEEACQRSDEAKFFEWDQRLHDHILSLGNSRRGREVLAKLRTQTRLLADSTAKHSRSLTQIHAEHLPIVEAICNHDPAAAAQAMHAHLQATGILLLKQTIIRHDPAMSASQVEATAQAIWREYTSCPQDDN